LYYKESTKEIKKNAQKIHFLFIIIAIKIVKTHKKRFWQIKTPWKVLRDSTTLLKKMVVFYCKTITA